MTTDTLHAKRSRSAKISAARPARELSALHCHACRRWIAMQDKHNVFASGGDGHRLAVTVWTCPECSRGEVT